MSSYIQQYNIKAILFTNDHYAISYCSNLGITTYPIKEVNKDNYPFFKHLIKESMRLTTSNVYIYINADIIMNPGILHASNALWNTQPTQVVSFHYAIGINA